VVTDGELKPRTWASGLSTKEWTSLLQQAANADATVRAEALIGLTQDFGNPDIAGEQINAFHRALERHVRRPDPFGSTAIATRAAKVWWALVSADDRLVLIRAALGSPIEAVVSWGVERAAELIAAPATDDSIRTALQASIRANLAGADVGRRRVTVKALARLSRPADWVDWNALLEDDDTPVRWSAQFALSRIDRGPRPLWLWPEQSS
jgi:hypothetical protein